MQLPQASGLQRTEEVTARVGKLLGEYPEVVSCTGINGYSVMEGGELSNAATLLLFYRIGNFVREKGKARSTSSTISMCVRKNRRSCCICRESSVDFGAGSKRRIGFGIAGYSESGNNRTRKCGRCLVDGGAGHSRVGYGEQFFSGKFSPILFERR